MERAGEAIQRIKPVFMMSPLSVAIHLPPSLPMFDLVIFDEASQVKPEDALCAIARAKQCIVVGDSKQMPPTTFFDRLAADDDGAVVDDTPAEELGTEAKKLESVLSLMGAVAAGEIRRPMLRWHYRSIHSSLIQPSNEMFYDSRLVVFPSPSANVFGTRVGLVLHHDPSTVYEGGSKNRVNAREAIQVADRVLSQVLQCPTESLMVAAMNKPQADLIYDEVSKREREHPAEFATYRSLHPYEPLDVKNLETVQGDERDVVLVSVTYGRDVSGVIRQQYGPLLQDGGERRLNVLFTRARKRCEVFTNLAADDIRVETPRPGVVTLKRFLQFAQDGVLDVSTATGGAPESPFEEEVAEALRSQGFEVHSQVGCEGYRIDMCVLHPQKKGVYVLGIECDGATYHAARSARDRDKLRQRVLESRGWRLHRIWSTDWWQDRDRETDRLVRAVRSAIDSEGSEQDSEENCEATEFQVMEEAKMSPPPLTRTYDSLPTKHVGLDLNRLCELCSEVIAVEGPISSDLLMLRLREGAGLSRVNSSTKKLLQIAIRTASPQKRIADAYYSTDSQLFLPRDWSSRPSEERKVQHVTEPEIAAAIKSVVRRAFGIAEKDAAKEAWSLLGFQRVTAGALSRADAVVAKLIESNGLQRKEDGTLHSSRP